MKSRSALAFVVGGLAVLAVIWFLRSHEPAPDEVAATGPAAAEPAPAAAVEQPPAVPEDVRRMVERVAAGELPEEMVDRSADFRALQAEANERVADDPAAALAWALALPPDDALFAARQVLDRWVTTDPAAALAAAESIDGAIPGLRDQAVIGVLSRWGATDPASAWGAAAAIDPLQVRALAQTQLGLSWVMADPAAAAVGLREASIAAGDGGDVTHLFAGLGAAANALADVDPEGAVAWAATLPDNAARPALYGAIVRRWSDIDPVAASTWVAEQDPGASRDAGSEAIAHAIMHSDPERAAAWAGDIADPGRRSSVVAQVAASWFQVDRAAAESFLANSPDLSAEQRESIAAVQDAIDSISQ